MHIMTSGDSCVCGYLLITLFGMLCVVCLPGGSRWLRVKRWRTWNLFICSHCSHKQNLCTSVVWSSRHCYVIADIM